MPAKKVEIKPLTSKEERFCYEYLANGFNATKACMKAGYAKKTAYASGSRLLKNVKIQTRIQEMKDNLAETAGISALMIANEHAKIAFSNVANMFDTWIERKELDGLTADQKSCIQEISTKVVKVNMGSADMPMIADVEYVKVKTYDKQKSLDSLTDLLGYKTPTKTEITAKGFNIIVQSKETIEEINKLS